jgi:hypothetical protein
MDQRDIREVLYQDVLAPGEGILKADQIEQMVDYERIDGSLVQFSIPAAAFEKNLAVFAKTGRSALGGGGSDLVHAGRWLNFMMMEKANDMSPVGQRGYRLTDGGWLLPWD